MKRGRGKDGEREGKGWREGGERMEREKGERMERGTEESSREKGRGVRRQVAKE